ASFLLLCDTDILRLGADELPNLITLQTADAEIPHVTVMVGSARSANIGQQLNNSVLGRACHSHRGSNRASLDEAANNLCASLDVQAIHNDSLYHSRFSMSITKTLWGGRIILFPVTQLTANFWLSDTFIGVRPSGHRVGFSLQG